MKSIHNKKNVEITVGSQKKTTEYKPNTDISGPNAWSEDFSYDYYISLLKVAQENFEFYLLSDAERILKNPHEIPVLFLRHDIDVSVENALNMARIDQDMGIRATYYVRLNTAFYSLYNPPTQSILMKIFDMGHDIGLHYDHTRDSDILSSCNALERITNVAVRSVSYHIPLPNQMRETGLKVCGRINTYTHKLRRWYMSDSSGRWWDGEPIPRLKKSEGLLLQLVIHPIWWGKKVIPLNKRERIIQQILEGW